MATNKTKQPISTGRSRNASNATEGNTKTVQQGAEGLVLDDWQKAILAIVGHFLLCTGRQVGKTTIMAIKAALYMINNPGAKIIVVSLTEDQAQLIIVMILNYLEKNYKHLIKRPYSRNLTKNKIVLVNKSQVLSRPVGQTGDAVRGFTGDILIIDEASKMPESVFTAAKPTLLTTGGKIWMCSTPFGKKGYFYESWLNKNKRFEIFHISSEDVISERTISHSWTEHQRVESMKLLDEEKLDMGRLQYAQEYQGLFLDDLQQIFTDELIQKICTAKRTAQRKGLFYLGVDIARMGDDSSSYEIIRKDPSSLVHVENITTKKKFTNETYDKILDLEAMWDFKQIAIDAGSGSLGVGILDWLMKPESGVNKKVIALNNIKRVLDKWGTRARTLLKEDLYSNLLLLMERGEIVLLNDDNLRLSLKSCQQEYIMKDGQKTKVKIYSSRHKDSDIVEGLVRSAWLANQKNINTTISYF